MAEVDKPLILNVNDHDQTRYLVRKILEPRGFRVIEAKTGEEALHALDQHPLLVVLDVKLPDLSGFEVCRMIKASPKTSSILVLLTSATYVTTDRRVQGLDVGADGYLAAPYEPTELVATVKSLLRLGAAERNLREHANQLRENDRRKDEFLAMLAHELRNPLAAINSALPLLDSYRQADERFERVRSMVGRQVTHLAKMVDELLDVSRITQGRIELTRAPVSLAEVIEHALSAARPLFEQRRQKVEVKLEDPRFTVDGDATRLEQVIGNLLDNASKYTEPSGRIELDVRQDSRGGTPEVVMTVKDDGMGITADVLAHVFEPFVQAEQNLARTRGGMGVGLTLVKRLVELHGGKVAARSEGAGKGAEIEVRLPLSASSKPNPDEGAFRAGKAGAGRKILLVEDNEDARQALAELLELMGHDVDTAEDGKAGVERAQAGSPDVVLVDIGLPGIDGYEVARRIRYEEGTARKKFLVALTGYGGTEQKNKALSAGFDVHVVKPVDLGVLTQLLEKL